jgi:hypothetical protein
VLAAKHNNELGNQRINSLYLEQRIGTLRVPIRCS